MRSIKIVLTVLGIPFLYVSCKRDDYHKAELRCNIDSKICTITDPSKMDEFMPEAKAFHNKQAMDLAIQGSVMDKDGNAYELYLHIKPFIGKGYYPVNMMSGFVVTPESNSGSFSNYYDVDSTYDGAMHITKFVDGEIVGGYFHFAGTGDLCGGTVFISNGRFALKSGS